MMSGLLPPLSSRTSPMSRPTCCCSVSLDRCDLLVGLEGFHLMSVARSSQALVLDVESCNQLVGCPGCGVIAQGHGRVVVEAIDAPWAGVPAWIRWHNTALDVPRTHLRNGDIPGAQREGVCSPGAFGCAGDPLGDPTVALRGSHYLGAGPTARNHVDTVWSPIKPYLHAASDDPTRFTGVRVLGVDERRVAPLGPTPPWPT